METNKDKLLVLNLSEHGTVDPLQLLYALGYKNFITANEMQNVAKDYLLTLEKLIKQQIDDASARKEKETLNRLEVEEDLIYQVIEILEKKRLEPHNANLIHYGEMALEDWETKVICKEDLLETLEQYDKEKEELEGQIKEGQRQLKELVKEYSETKYMVLFGKRQLADQFNKLDGKLEL
jgi:hypothetical protein